MGIGHEPGERTDPLEQRFVGKATVLAMLLVAIVAFVCSARRPDPVPLPGVALDSPFLLDLERAAVVAALVVGATVFLVRGWAGYFPSKLSTSGAEYETRWSAERTAENDDAAIDVLAEIKLERVAMAKSVGEDIRALELKVDALASEAQRAERSTMNIDDMV